jgi:glutathione peroxidase
MKAFAELEKLERMNSKNSSPLFPPFFESRPAMSQFTMMSAFGTLVLATAFVFASDAKSPLDHQVTNIDGKPVDLAQYKGKVVLVVNVASRCGNTKQYTNLESLYKKYNEKGLVVLGFPANEFGKQEPGTDSEIKEFCTSKYQINFPMFSKIVVKGEGIAPLYQHLTSKETNGKHAGPISWNFEKFLIGRDGQVAARFAPKLNPESPEVVAAIEAELAKK